MNLMDSSSNIIYNDSILNTDISSPARTVVNTDEDQDYQSNFSPGKTDNDNQSALSGVDTGLSQFTGDVAYIMNHLRISANSKTTSSSYAMEVFGQVLDICQSRFHAKSRLASSGAAELLVFIFRIYQLHDDVVLIACRALSQFVVNDTDNKMIMGNLGLCAEVVTSLEKLQENNQVTIQLCQLVIDLCNAILKGILHKYVKPKPASRQGNNKNHNPSAAQAPYNFSVPGSSSVYSGHSTDNPNTTEDMLFSDNREKFTKANIIPLLIRILESKLSKLIAREELVTIEIPLVKINSNNNLQDSEENKVVDEVVNTEVINSDANIDDHTDIEQSPPPPQDNEVNEANDNNLPPKEPNNSAVHKEVPETITRKLVYYSFDIEKHKDIGNCVEIILRVIATLSSRDETNKLFGAHNIHIPICRIVNNINNLPVKVIIKALYVIVTLCADAKNNNKELFTEEYNPNFVSIGESIANILALLVNHEIQKEEEAELSRLLEYISWSLLNMSLASDVNKQRFQRIPSLQQNMELLVTRMEELGVSSAVKEKVLEVKKKIFGDDPIVVEATVVEDKVVENTSDENNVHQPTTDEEENYSHAPFITKY